MDAIILAGGKGIRLKEVVSDVPKPMAVIHDKPFLFYLLQRIREFPVDKIILSVGYKSETIINYFGHSFGCIPLEYAKEEKPLGTGGAIVNAVKETTGCNILILNGDTWFPIDLNKFYSHHVKNNHLFTIALKRLERFSRYGSVEISGDTITGFNEKKYCENGVINGGIYLVNRHFFESRQFPEVFSLEDDILAMEAGSDVFKGVVFNEPFIDIGVPEDYHRARSVICNE
ncbi:MAG: nucleotidyltransferase family protein [Bacteroidota bacterium]